MVHYLNHLQNQLFNMLNNMIMALQKKRYQDDKKLIFNKYLKYAKATQSVEDDHYFWKYIDSMANQIYQSIDNQRQYYLKYKKMHTFNY